MTPTFTSWAHAQVVAIKTAAQVTMIRFIRHAPCVNDPTRIWACTGRDEVFDDRLPRSSGPNQRPWSARVELHSARFRPPVKTIYRPLTQPVNAACRRGRPAARLAQAVVAQSAKESEHGIRGWAAPAPPPNGLATKASRLPCRRRW